MATQTRQSDRRALPRLFDELVRLLPPMAIRDDVHHAITVEMVDRLMQVEHPSAGQAEYLETLVQLVEVYEAAHHSAGLSGATGLSALRHVTEESALSASDLARLLGVHVSLGSKLLKGERHLTWEHAKTLGSHFRLAPSVFMD